MAITPGSTAGVLVKAKLAETLTPSTEAVTTYDPSISLAVSAGAAASPAPLVVDVFAPPVKLAPGPADGRPKVTTTPLTGFPAASRTATTSGALKLVPATVLCGVPLVAITCA